MIKLFHFVIITAIKGKYYAFPVAIRTGENISRLFHLEEIFDMVLCDTATQAHYMAQSLNNEIMETGSYTRP